jgi:indole-3-glycerol phosphate synthase
MSFNTGTILDRIARIRARRVAEQKLLVSEATCRELAGAMPPKRDVVAALLGWPADKRAIISEIKRRSPSKGDLALDLDPASLAREYEEAGAFAISVLVEPDFFGGSLADLDAARSATECFVLYKDFVVDPYQLFEARAHGADMALLIAALLGSELKHYVELATEAGVEPLVEVHDEAELALALESGAKLVGVNNRNLKTFVTDLAVGERLIPRMPPGVVAVAESGMNTVADLDRLEAAGARAFLIGEALVTSGKPLQKLRKLVERI